MRRADAAYMHTLDGSTFLHDMTSWPPSWKCGVKSKVGLRQSMRACVYSKNNCTKFHFFFEERHNKMNSDPDPKLVNCTSRFKFRNRSVLMLDFSLLCNARRKNRQIYTQQQTCRFVLMLILLELFALFWTHKVHYQCKLQNFDDGGILSEWSYVRGWHF